MPETVLVIGGGPAGLATKTAVICSPICFDERAAVEVARLPRSGLERAADGAALELRAGAKIRGPAIDREGSDLGLDPPRARADACQDLGDVGADLDRRAPHVAVPVERVRLRQRVEPGEHREPRAIALPTSATTRSSATVSVPRRIDSVLRSPSGSSNTNPARRASGAASIKSASRAGVRAAAVPGLALGRRMASPWRRIVPGRWPTCSFIRWAR